MADVRDPAQDVGQFRRGERSHGVGKGGIAFRGTAAQQRSALPITGRVTSRNRLVEAYRKRVAAPRFQYAIRQRPIARAIVADKAKTYPCRVAAVRTG